MLGKSLILPLLILFTGSQLGHGQPGPFQTSQNSALLFPASDLVTNGAPGLTNPPSKLMVSAVTASSVQGGRITMLNTQVWAMYYSGKGTSLNQATCMAVDEGGNVYVAGQSYTASGSDFATVKYASDGNPLWTNRYDGPVGQDDLVCALALDGFGNVFVTGYSLNTNAVYDVATIKYSGNGTALWTNRFNESISNGFAPFGLVTDPTGNAYLLAYNYFAASDLHTCTLLKYDPAGNAVWTNHYNDPARIEDNPRALAIDSAGNLRVACGSEGTGTGEDYAILKYTSDGMCLWTNRYSHTFTDIPEAMTLDRAGNAIVTGDSMDASSHLYATIKYAGDGTPLWTNLLTGPRYQGGAVPQVAADLAGNVFISAGSPGVTNTGDYLILKLDPNGVSLWTNHYVGLGASNGVLMASTTDSVGSFYGAGYSVPPGGANNEAVLVKYAGDGTPRWTNHFDGPPGSEAYGSALVADAAGNIYLTGQAGVAHQAQSQFATVKFADYVSYAPPTNFVGRDAFAFTVTDSSGNRVTSVVSVVVSPWPPQIALRPIDWSDSNGFRLRVDGAIGPNPVVLYASTNLVSWEPVSTNLPVQGSCQFHDPFAAAVSRRFYRAVQ
jgi:hypothetical protein